jgi:tRNA dimethylallyltransferase
MIRRPVVCLMGPTASGKTDIAVRLQQRFPMDIISVDSALVYRGMNIGTAKPDADTLEIAPHRLIDIRDPEQAYSAGDFVVDAQREIDSIHSAGRIPLLVGGTMMYFRSLTEGLADLPQANEAVRQKLDAVARESGWPHLHARLSRIDPAAAKRINENDSQRIQRALEVYETSGKTLTEWHAIALPPNTQYRFIKVAVVAADRQLLHERIGERFESMLDQGFVDEVRGLMQRAGLAADSASMRAVGYRQIWAHLEGQYDLPTAVHKAKAATRQLAKRQMTWLRTEKQLIVFDPLEMGANEAISAYVAKQMDE